jgi:hypothetical protein
MSLPLKLIPLFAHQPVTTITSRRFFRSALSYRYCNSNNYYNKAAKPNTAPSSRRYYCQHRRHNNSSHEIIIRRQHFYREYSASTSNNKNDTESSYEPPFFNDISQLPPSSSSILKQEDRELSMDEIKLKIALNEYLNEIKSITANSNDNINDNQKYLLDELQQAYMDIEYWEEALQIEQYKCRVFYNNTDTSTDIDTNATNEYADSIHVQGKLYLRQLDFINSKRLYDESLTYFEKTKNTIQQGHVLISLAGWYFFQQSNNDDNQQKHLNMAMDCLKQSELMLDSNPALLVKCLDNQGLIYRLWGEYNIALDKYQQALQVVIDKETKSALLMHIADMYVALEVPNDALIVYQDLLMEISSSNTNTTSQEQDDDLGIRGVLLHNIATIHVDQGEHELALEEFREALRIKQIAGGENNPEVAKTLNSLGALHAGVFNDKLQALDYFKQALLIARIHVDNNNDTDIMNALQNISLMEQDLYGERQS